MRRKTKQLLATGAMLAVLAAGAVSASAAEKCTEKWFGKPCTGTITTTYEKSLFSNTHKVVKTCSEHPLAHSSTSWESCTASDPDTCENRVCSVCGDEMTDLEHDYGEVTCTASDVTKDGNQTYTASRTCKRKNCKHEDAVTNTGYGTLVKKATCVDNAVYNISDISVVLGGKLYTLSGGDKEAPNTALGHKFTNYVSNNDATCAKDGTKTAACDHDGCTETDTITDEGSKLAHVYTKEPVWSWNSDYTAATATFTCDVGNETVPVDASVVSETTDPVCTEAGEIVYIATVEFNGKPYTDKKTVEVPALGHSFTNYCYNNDATCTEDGTETAQCDRCDATDTRTAFATAGHKLHNVNGVEVCSVCGEVNGEVVTKEVAATADANPSTIGRQVVVRVGTLSNGKKVMTVSVLDNGVALSLNGSYKVRVSLADLKAQLGEEGEGFEHSLVCQNHSFFWKKHNVGYSVENGQLVFDAEFGGSDAAVMEIA